MKSIRLYNMIFPIWLLIFIPPIILGVLAVNFIIDSIVVLICCYIFRRCIGDSIFHLYKKSILKVWLIGFLADFVGAAIMFVAVLITDQFKVTSSVSAALMLNPFRSVWAIIVVLLSTILSLYFIYRWNFKRVYVKLIEDVVIRAKVSLIIAIVTAPWTFFLPTELIFHYQ